MTPIQTIVADVIRERCRQAAKYSDAHDDRHSDEELADAAAFLAASQGSGIHAPDWAATLSTKCDSRRQELVVAAALLVAEIERLDRIEARSLMVLS